MSETSSVSGARRCHYCREIEGVVIITRDHIIPRSMGGGDRHLNVTDACRGCNLRKADALLDHAGCQRCRDAHGAFRGRLAALARIDYANARWVTLDFIVTGHAPAALGG